MVISDIAAAVLQGIGAAAGLMGPSPLVGTTTTTTTAAAAGPPSEAATADGGEQQPQPQPRTTTKLKSSDPKWGGETVVLRCFMAAGALPLRLSHVVATVRHQARVGSDPILGEAVIPLHALPRSLDSSDSGGGSAAAGSKCQFSAALIKDGRRTGRMEGY
eukprot:SAG22_NODE_2753_length_2248_cov_1.772452_5_plen_160_part_01